MNELTSLPLFGVLMCIITFELGLLLYNKTKLPVFNPLLISILLIIGILLTFHIPYENFNNGGQLISFFLGPSTVILAVPLYKKLDLLKKNIIPILTGITIGSITGMVSLLLLCRLFELSNALTASLLPKSITTPIGVEVSKQLGGIQPVTVIAIIITGIIGSIIGPIVLKLFRIDDKIAKGIAMGTSSHAVGTAKALEMGSVEGAMSGLSIGIAGILTVVLAPLLWHLFLLIK